MKVVVGIRFINEASTTFIMDDYKEYNDAFKAITTWAYLKGLPPIRTILISMTEDSYGN